MFRHNHSRPRNEGKNNPKSPEEETSGSGVAPGRYVLRDEGTGSRMRLMENAIAATTADVWLRVITEDGVWARGQEGGRGRAGGRLERVSGALPPERDQAVGRAHGLVAMTHTRRPSKI